MRITLPSGTAAEVARPEGSPRLGLVVTPDIFGIRPHFDALAATWARDWGMAVAVVDQYAGAQPADDADVAARYAAVAGIDDERHLADLHAAADVLATPTVGLMGFCMGGMYCFNSARSERFARIVSFYGMITLPDAWKGPSHGEPLDYLRRGHADRVLAVIGCKDTWTPPDQVAQLRDVGVSVVEYAEAEHAFAHDPSRPVHRADDAVDAFARARAWLESA